MDVGKIVAILEEHASIEDLVASRGFVLKGNLGPSSFDQLTQPKYAQMRCVQHRVRWPGAAAEAVCKTDADCWLRALKADDNRHSRREEECIN